MNPKDKRIAKQRAELIEQMCDKIVSNDNVVIEGKTPIDVLRQVAANLHKDALRFAPTEESE
jgi:hypothetical protein